MRVRDVAANLATSTDASDNHVGRIRSGSTSRSQERQARTPPEFLLAHVLGPCPGSGYRRALGVLTYQITENDGSPPHLRTKEIAMKRSIWIAAIAASSLWMALRWMAHDDEVQPHRVPHLPRRGPYRHEHS